MVENPAPEGAPGRPANPTEDKPARTEGGSGLRAVSWTIAAVSASALVGGGIGMLGGFALGALNPFGLGMVGVVLGTCASVPLTRAALKR